MKELIVITHPEMLPGEAGIINRLFGHGLARLHIRKPGASEAQLRALLEQLDRQYSNRIALHQHHKLAAAFGITGLHFPESDRLAQSGKHWKKLQSEGFVISTSLHAAADVENLSDCFDYVFLGPVFDSISKKGYRGRMAADFRLEKHHYAGKVIALGGIEADNLPSVFKMGFDGAALLGSIWQDPENALTRLQQCQLLQSSSFHPADSEIATGVAKFHFISQETATMSHIDSIRLALQAGCRWIQLRVKNRPEEEVLAMAWEASRLCDSYGAKLIINDFPRVALAVDACGLHLGLTDMPVPEARALVGERMIIGGTANTWADIVLRINEGADYIGLGPFRFTNTKQNLSPIVGIEGYGTLMRQMEEAGHITPIIAIGGITPEDISPIRATGIYGVAMSGALIGAADPRETFYQIQQTLC